MSQWYLSQGGQQQGPMTQHQLQQMAGAGQLGPDAHISGPGLTGWVAASQVQALWSAPGPQTPPPAGAPPGGYAGAPPAGHAGGPPAGGPPAGGPGGPPGGYAGAPPAGYAGAPPAGYAGGPPAGYAGAPPAGYAGAPPAGYAGGPGVNGPANAAFPLGMPPDAQPQGEPKSSWVKERLKGLGAIGGALLLLLLNVITLMSSNTFYPKTIIIGLGFLGYGGWVVFFGDEYDDYTLELVRWKQVGMYACGAVGVLLGIIISVAIAE